MKKGINVKEIVNFDLIEFRKNLEFTDLANNLGEKSYTKLNHATGEITQSKDTSIFSKDYQLIFENLK